MNSNNPFTTYGRTTRTRYIAAVIALFVLWLSMRSLITVYTPGEAFMRIILSSFILWPGYCITVMRLHDADKTSLFALGALTTAVIGMLVEATSDTLSYAQSAAYLVIAIVSLTTLLCIIIVSILPPVRGPNRYGDDPRGNVDPAVRAAELDAHKS